jgi:aminopeptidase YwaD
MLNPVPMRVNVLRLVAAALAIATISASPLQQQATGLALSGEQAKLQVDVLAGEIGERPAGSGKYDRAVLYASEQLLSWGYQPILQSFPILSYDDRGSTVEVVSAVGVRITPDTLMYSTAGDVSGPLVAVPGVGQPDDFAGVDVRGKIALIKRGSLRFAEKVDNAAAVGAAGVIIFNEASERVRGSLSRPGGVPAVTVSGDDGRQLLELLAAGPAVVRVAVEAITNERPSTNVVAELPGSRADAGTVVFGGHLDSVSGSPGANDNASGSAVVLELARLLASVDPSQRPQTLRFVLFGAEELGLHGSRHYVDTLTEADRRAIVAMINLDMVGVGDAWRFGGTEELVQRALGATNDLGERALPLRGPLSGASDHASFIDRGVPALFIHRVDDPNYHSSGDRPSEVDPRALSNAGTIALRVFESLADQ